MRVIFARASTIYKGRVASAELSLGDLLITIRDVESGGDGSCLIFWGDQGVTPRNWMPAGSVLTESPGQMIFRHAAREELLEIYIERVYWEQAGIPTLKGERVILGAEKEVSDLLSENLHCLGDDHELNLIKREFRTPRGPIDLLCRSGKQPFDLVAIEVKRRKVTINDCYQLIRYLESLDAMEGDELAAAVSDQTTLALSDVPSQGLLVAPSLANNAKSFINEHSRLQFVRVSYDSLLEQQN